MSATRTRAGQLELPLRYKQAQTVGRAHLALDGRLVSYTVKRSERRRAISIVVDEEGVRVGAPLHVPELAIERMLRKHSNWVLKKIDEWQVKRAPTRRWIDGEPLMLFGTGLELRLATQARQTRLDGTTLVVPATSDIPVSRLVVEWLHQQALACFVERTAYFRRLLSVERTPQVHLSSARSRWGSCHTSGRIHLNWRLIQMPRRLIDYVVAHEVAHLIEMNHSHRFWKLVGRVIPDYELRRKEIRRDAHRYLLV